MIHLTARESPTGYLLCPLTIHLFCIILHLLHPLFLLHHIILISLHFLLVQFHLHQTMHCFHLSNLFSIQTLFVPFSLSIPTISHCTHWPTNQLQRRSAQWLLLLMRSFVSPRLFQKIRFLDYYLYHCIHQALFLVNASLRNVLTI